MSGISNLIGSIIDSNSKGLAKSTSHPMIGMLEALTAYENRQWEETISVVRPIFRKAIRDIHLQACDKSNLSKIIQEFEGFEESILEYIMVLTNKSINDVYNDLHNSKLRDLIYNEIINCLYDDLMHINYNELFELYGITGNDKGFYERKLFTLYKKASDQERENLKLEIPKLSHSQLLEAFDMNYFKDKVLKSIFTSKSLERTILSAYERYRDER